MNTDKANQLIDNLWRTSIVPTLEEYIRIPNKSPYFDPDWASKGHMDEAVELLAEWCRAHAAPGMTMETVRLPGRTPVLLLEIPGSGDRRVLLYGHLDKQPEMTGWREGYGPWIPVLDGDRLYGRGGADDGYAVFASLTAALVLAEQQIPHANLTILIEASEESGSPDLPAYMEHLSDRIGSPDLVVCLDSGCGNYDQLWCTTSLRGMVAGVLTVEILDEGVHSGDAGGIVPSSFRIARSLLSRLEDEATGEILVRDLHVNIPGQRREQAQLAAEVLGDEVYRKFPFHGDSGPFPDAGKSVEGAELVLNRTWRPAVEVIGAEGLPALLDGGNVLRPRTSLKLSFRLPPHIDSARAVSVITGVLEADPPHGAAVRFHSDKGGNGWEAPAMPQWLEETVDMASREHFGKPAMYMGEGGTIPFMAMLGEALPEAQFLITGVLGPHSNAHGPNEFLHIPTARKISACTASVLADHYRIMSGDERG